MTPDEGVELYAQFYVKVARLPVAARLKAWEEAHRRWLLLLADVGSPTDVPADAVRAELDGAFFTAATFEHTAAAQSRVLSLAAEVSR